MQCCRDISLALLDSIGVATLRDIRKKEGGRQSIKQEAHKREGYIATQGMLVRRRYVGIGKGFRSFQRISSYDYRSGKPNNVASTGNLRLQSCRSKRTGNWVTPLLHRDHIC